jgi:MoaA/NifB/PqqE/SkfB family radical SAM enzyme
MLTMLRRHLGAPLRGTPIWRAGQQAEQLLLQAQYRAARVLPILARPNLKTLDVSITGLCNLRCIGCNYGRSFQVGEQLPIALVRGLIDDAAAAGARDIRWYGGEPLLHPDLPEMVSRTLDRGMSTYVTTNALLLADRMSELWEAGLRAVSMGLYGIGADYDEYVQRPGRFERVERSIATVRERYGSEMMMRVNWLLSRRSATVASWEAALDFARRYDLQMQIDIVHYSLPYFNEGPDRALQFTADDRSRVQRVADAILMATTTDPGRIATPLAGLRALTDWAIEGPDMRVPCDAGEMLWIGPDGTVQLCYVEFPLGNLHRSRLSTMIGTAAHVDAARRAFATDCANCHCHYASRTTRANGFRYPSKSA